jgi:hypothetical protein
MPGPVHSEVHVDVPLSTIATAYKNQDYISDLLFPKVTSDKQSNKYYTWTKDMWFRNMVELRAPGSDYPEASLKLSTDSFYCDEYHLGYRIPDENLDNQDPAVQQQEAGSEYLSDQFALNREIKITSDIFTTSKWGTDKVPAPTWDDYANSTPEVDVDTGINTIETATGRTPTVFCVGSDVHLKLKRHPRALEVFKYTQKAILNETEVQQWLGVPKYIVGKAIQTTSYENAATITYSRIWGKHGLLLHVAGAPKIRVPTAGYTFVWSLTGNPGIEVAITPVRDEMRDSLLLKGKHAFDHKIVGSDLGYFFNGAVA